jgi:hypothetical protein
MYRSHVYACQILTTFLSRFAVADGDQAKFERLRGVELKHGRVVRKYMLLNE